MREVSSGINLQHYARFTFSLSRAAGQQNIWATLRGVQKAPAREPALLFGTAARNFYAGLTEGRELPGLLLDFRRTSRQREWCLPCINQVENRFFGSPSPHNISGCRIKSECPTEFFRDIAVRRLTLFAKGNIDVHDSLHSCRIAGDVLWNGINDVVRAQFPDTLIRLKHETGLRSDALVELTGSIPQEIAERGLPLGVYPPEIQFTTGLFDTKADAIILTVQPDLGTGLVRHNISGRLFYPNNADKWDESDRRWLRSDFTRMEPLDAAASMRNFSAIIEKIRMRSEAPILIYNASPITPGERVHCHQGLGETHATRIRRFNLGLIDLSEATGISIVDVDTIIARAGADKLKLDAVHFTADGYRLVAEEVVRILADLGVIDASEAAA